MAKRGRKPASTPLALRVHERLSALGIPSVAALEQRAGLSADAFRDILRGKIGRNRAVKLAMLERVASVLGVPPSELAVLAGLVAMDGHRVDHGTPELQMLRQRLAAGGDPRLCGTALGVLLAHGEVPGRLGITQAMHDAGQRFADLVTRALPGAPKRPASVLAQLGCPAGGRQADEDTMALRIDLARAAWQALQQADREAGQMFVSRKPSVVMWEAAVQGALPGYAAPLANGPWNAAALAEWAALRWSLRVLRHHFRHSEEHRALVLAYHQRSEALP